MSIETICQIIGLLIAFITCCYTARTYYKSYNILDVIKSNNRYNWNKRELERLFSIIPIDCIESFSKNPYYIRDELWQGLRDSDMSYFQYDGKEKQLIVDFIKKLDAICDLSYRQTPSGCWKFTPISENEVYDKEIEERELKKLEKRVVAILPLYKDVKELLLKYHIDLKEINEKAYAYYEHTRNEKTLI